MKRAAIYGLMGIATLCAGTASLSTEALAGNPKWAIKGYGDIGLGRSLSVSEAGTGQSTGSNSNSFGLDVGYTFWQKGTQSLEANIGVGYSINRVDFGIGEMEYHYSAPTYADEDGNAYERYYRLSDLRQKTGMEYVNVPVYLQYRYRPVKWLGLYAEAGVGLSFNTKTWRDSVSGTAYAYGVFPEYDDLLIDADYLDDFGERSLGGRGANGKSVGSFGASLMVGAGLEIFTYEPVSFVVGVRYNHAFSNVFTGRYAPTSDGAYTAETAPVTYTVADGTMVKSLADYTTKSRLSPLSLHVGINIRF